MVSDIIRHDEEFPTGRPYRQESVVFESKIRNEGSVAISCGKYLYSEPPAIEDSIS